MSKILPNLFPFEDYLYIFQLFEYQPGHFLSWFFSHPLARNLQRKHTIVYTKKAALLVVCALFLQLLLSCVATQIYQPVHSPGPDLLAERLLIAAVIFFILQHLTPLFLVIANSLLWPIESYTKNRLLAAASTKIAKLDQLTVVAICGSFGKTSIKDMLYTLLWKDFYVVKTPKSFNTPVSVARTILSDLKPTTQVFLAEMDAYKPGEITQLAQLVRPKYGLITAIAPQHLSRFGSMERLAKTQFELAEQLRPDGTLFLNATDKWQMQLEKDYPVKKVFVGNENSDCYASAISQSTEGIQFVLHTKEQQQKITLPLYGEHHVANFVAAAATALKLGMPLDRIAERAQKLLPTPHRLEVKQLSAMTLIDNTYNTNPTAAQSSLKLLHDLGKDRQKIIITPGLIELGQTAKEENQKFGTAIAEVADIAIIVGENAKDALVSGLRETNFAQDSIIYAKSTAQAMRMLSAFAKPNAVVLLENDLPDQYF